MVCLSPVKKFQLEEVTPNNFACAFKIAGVSCAGSIVIDAIPKLGLPKTSFYTQHALIHLRTNCRASREKNSKT
jgi:hypothetical protein